MANTVNLYFNVDKQNITRTDDEKVASGAVNTIIANFNFGESWEDLYTFCRFESAGGMKDVRIVDNACVVPWEVLEEPGFTMACFGSKSTDVMLTTDKLSVKVYKGVNFIVNAALPADETPTLIRQYEGIVNRAAKVSKELEQYTNETLSTAVSKANEATDKANAAAKRADNAITELEGGNVPILTISDIDSLFG